MKLKMSAALLLSLFVAACAQQSEPEPVMIEPEPVYDKYGNPM